MDSPKTVAYWKRELPKIKDVVELEKLLKAEQESEKPRESIVKMMTEKIGKLTLSPKDELKEKIDIPTSPNDDNKKPDIKGTMTVLPDVIISQERSIERVMLPIEKALEKIDVKALIWKDTKDVAGFTKIKQSIKALVTLRTAAEADRKTFNAPFSSVISETNLKVSDVVAQIKDIETILKDRKVAFDTEKTRLKVIADDKKAIALAKEQEKQAEQKEELNQSNQEIVKSEQFLAKFGGILDRAKANSSKGKDVYKENGDPFAETEEAPKEIHTIEAKTKPITDVEKLRAKMALLTEVLEIEDCDSEKFIKICSVIDSNVGKVIEWVNKQQ